MLPRRESIVTGKIFVEINPVPKPRMTQRDKWVSRPCTRRYRQYKDSLREKMEGVEIVSQFSIMFALPMPSSWSDKKKNELEGCLHLQRPDLDNLIKGFQDALLVEDSTIADIRAAKIWAKSPYIVFYPYIVMEFDK